MPEPKLVKRVQFSECVPAGNIEHRGEKCGEAPSEWSKLTTWHPKVERLKPSVCLAAKNAWSKAESKGKALARTNHTIHSSAKILSVKAKANQRAILQVQDIRKQATTAIHTRELERARTNFQMANRISA